MKLHEAIKLREAINNNKRLTLYNALVCSPIPETDKNGYFVNAISELTDETISFYTLKEAEDILNLNT